MKTLDFQLREDWCIEVNTEKRRLKVLRTLEANDKPISATNLAKALGVSRQIIVGDVALLRAEGNNIFATPRGYILERAQDEFPYVGILACQHNREETLEELCTIVDFGATVIDVTVEHSIYGQIQGQLNISSRYDAELFCKKLIESDAKPLSDLTDGIHLHSIGCNNKSIFEKIKDALTDLGYTL